MKAIQNLSLKVKSLIEDCKGKLKVKYYSYIQEQYFKNIFSKNKAFEEIKDDTYYISRKFIGCNNCVTNPYETIYYALKQIHGGTLNFLLITGFHIEYGETFKVTINLKRPGLLIGKGGRDIDNLSSLLTKYFGKQTEIKIIEDNVEFIADEW